MYLLVLGLVLTALKLLGIAPMAGWPWWGVLAPFVLAALWWLVADMTGFTKKRATEREQARQIERKRKRMARGLQRRN